MKQNHELLYKSIDEIGQMYRKKEVSPYEVTKATFERLAELEPKLNAFVTVLKNEALEQAKNAESAFLKGEEVGKLYGIPVSLKDIFDTKGIRTSLGSRIMKDNVPTQNSYVYDALVKSGAIMFGKTNMLEFAYGAVHPDYGQCNNPWDVTRTSGGSSSGSAASVAAGIGFGSIGTDTGGSIRGPAAFCGIVGLKPTYGLVPSNGLFPLSKSLDHIGTLTRTVRDNAIMLESISDKQFDYDTLFNGKVAGLKVGVIRSLIDTLTREEVKNLVNRSIQQLQSLGMEVIDVDIPGIESIETTAMPLVLAEATFIHRQWKDRESDYAEATYSNIKQGYHVTAISYIEALEKRRLFTEQIKQVMEHVDLLVCPTLPMAATTTDPTFEDGDIDVSQRTIPFNVTGNPAINMSAGNTNDGYPIGFQIIGKHYDEEMIYKVADAYQILNGGYNPPPI